MFKPKIISSIKAVVKSGWEQDDWWHLAEFFLLGEHICILFTGEKIGEEGTWIDAGEDRDANG